MVKGYSKVVNVYRPDLITEGLTCALDFTPASRSFTDLSGNGNDASLVGHPRHESSLYGGTAYFRANSSDDPYGSLTGKTDINPGTGNYSVAFYFKNTSSSAFANELFSANKFSVYVASTNPVRTDFTGGSSIETHGSTPVGEDLLYYHVVVVVDRTNATGYKIYLNGKEESYTRQDDITSVAGDNVTFTSALIGRFQGSAKWWAQSNIGGMSFYNRALSAMEVTKLYDHFNTSIAFKVDWNLTATNTNQETFVENLPARKNGAGTLKVTTDTYKGDSVKVLTTAGAAAANGAIPWGYYAENTSQAAYGEWRFIATSTTGACGVYLVSDTNDASGSYYLLQVDGGNGQIKLIESGATATAITYTAGTWADIKIIRRKEGAAHNFYIYVNGVLATAATGSNPHNDSTITTSSYMMPYVSAANDKIIMADKTGKYSFYKK